MVSFIHFNRFLADPENSFTANGCVNDGGRNLPLSVTIENDFQLICTNEDGFRFSCCICPDMPPQTRCVLANGTQILTRSLVNYQNGTIRVDATNQYDYSWFWLEVGPRLA